MIHIPVRWRRFTKKHYFNFGKKKCWYRLIDKIREEKKYRAMPGDDLTMAMSLVLSTCRKNSPDTRNFLD